MVPTNVEQRLARLEGELRRWRIGAACGVAALAVGLTALLSGRAGASDSSQRLTLQSPDKRHKLQLDSTSLTISVDGETTALLSGAPSEGAPGCTDCGRVGVTFYLPHGKGTGAHKPRVDLSAYETSSSLTLTPPGEGQESTTLSAP